MEYRVSKLPVHVASRHQSQCPQTFRLQQFEYVFAYVLALVFVFVLVYVYVYSLIRLFVSLYLIINSRHSARVRWPFMNYKRRWQRFRFAFDCNWQTREAERQRWRGEEQKWCGGLSSMRLLALLGFAVSDGCISDTHCDQKRVCSTMLNSEIV